MSTNINSTQAELLRPDFFGNSNSIPHIDLVAENELRQNVVKQIGRNGLLNHFMPEYTQQHWLDRIVVADGIKQAQAKVIEDLRKGSDDILYLAGIHGNMTNQDKIDPRLQANLDAYIKGAITNAASIVEPSPYTGKPNIENLYFALIALEKAFRQQGASIDDREQNALNKLSALGFDVNNPEHREDMNAITRVLSGTVPGSLVVLQLMLELAIKEDVLRLSTSTKSPYEFVGRMVYIMTETLSKIASQEKYDVPILKEFAEEVENSILQQYLETGLIQDHEVHEFVKNSGGIQYSHLCQHPYGFKGQAGVTNPYNKEDIFATMFTYDDQPNNQNNGNNRFMFGGNNGGMYMEQNANGQWVNANPNNILNGYTPNASPQFQTSVTNTNNNSGSLFGAPPVNLNNNNGGNNMYNGYGSFNNGNNMNNNLGSGFNVSSPLFGNTTVGNPNNTPYNPQPVYQQPIGNNNGGFNGYNQQPVQSVFAQAQNPQPQGFNYGQQPIVGQPNNGYNPNAMMNNYQQPMNQQFYPMNNLEAVRNMSTNSYYANINGRRFVGTLNGGDYATGPSAISNRDQMVNYVAGVKYYVGPYPYQGPLSVLDPSYPEDCTQINPTQYYNTLVHLLNNVPSAKGMLGLANVNTANLTSNDLGEIGRLLWVFWLRGKAIADPNYAASRFYICEYENALVNEFINGSFKLNQITSPQGAASLTIAQTQQVAPQPMQQGYTPMNQGFVNNNQTIQPSNGGFVGRDYFPSINRY